MKNMLMVVAILALAGGCKKKSADEKPATPGSSQAMTPDDKMGSAMPGSGSGSGSGSATAAGSGSGSAAPAAVTADSAQKLFDTCWGYFNDAKWDDFKGCYADDAVSETPGLGAPPATGNQAIADAAKAYKGGFPDAKGETQFLMINGHTMVSAVLLTGTNSGAMKMPGMPEMPATSKKAGTYFTQVLALDDAGKVKHEWDFYDLATTLGQLTPSKEHPVRAAIEKLMGPKEVVVAKDDDKEKANLATVQKLFEALNKHDAKALGEVADDKLVWSEVADPKDIDKKTWLDDTQGLWKSFSDVKFTIGSSWAAGDYVAVVGNFDGTNDGDGHMMKKTGKKVSMPFLQMQKVENGKVTMVWVVYQNLGFMSQLGMAPPAPHAAGAGSGSGSAHAKK